MNRLSTADRAKVVAVLVEGNSLRGTARITGIARMTVEKLLRDLGAACERFHDRVVRKLRSARIECDEIWSFVGAKQKNVRPERAAEWGDIWTWTAIDPDSKLMVSWLVGGRDAHTAHAFMTDIAGRLSKRVQLTTDQNRLYLQAVENAFGADIDFATLEKRYGGVPSGAIAATRYSPSKITQSKRAVISGRPDPQKISTSYVERQNLTMRMGMRRFARLTNAFSKKAENHALMVALHFTYYNFARIHQSLRVTPAMEAGLTDHVWSIEEIVSLLDAEQRASA